MPSLSVEMAVSANGRLRTWGVVGEVAGESLADAFQLIDGESIIVRVFRMTPGGLKPVVEVGQCVEVCGRIVRARSATVLVANSIRLRE